MEQQRHVRTTDGVDEPVEAAGVIEVAVTHHDRFDTLRIDIEAAHVLDHPVGADPGVEEDPMLGPADVHRHERRVAVLGADDVGAGTLEDAHRHGRAGVERRAANDLVARQEQVGDVVDEDRDRDPLDRRQRDREAHATSVPIVRSTAGRTTPAAWA